MEKHIEENPLDIDREDDIQVNKNDISKKARTGRGFVAIEEIPDKDLEDLSEEMMVDEEDESDEDYIGKEDNDEKEKRIAQLTKELKYQEGAGVASVFTEEVEEKTRPQRKMIFWEESKKEKKIDEFKDLEKDTATRISRRKTDEPIRSTSFQQVMRKNRGRYIYPEKNIPAMNANEARDNFKTMSDSKKQRNFRQKIKDFLTTQLWGQTAEQKRDDMYSIDSLEDERPTLNGRPLDKKLSKEFIDDENVAA